jgi:hypothetical protein
MADEVSNIVSLKGAPIVPPGTPRPDVAEELEALAAMARAGALDGLVVALLFPDNCTSYRIKGRINRACVGVLEMVKFKLLYDDMMEDE